MKSFAEIREDLRNIRYYYSRKEKLEQNFQDVGTNMICNLANAYNATMCLATPKLFELYVYLYVKNNTQEAAAEEFNYAPEYVQRLNKQLIKFLQQKLTI